MNIVYFQKKKMISHFPEKLQNPIFDTLLCEEDCFEEVLDLGSDSKEPKIESFDEIHKNPVTLFEQDIFWENDELVCLLSKEKKLGYEKLGSDESLKVMRNESVKLMMKVVGHFSFSALTAVLAVNYFDRFVAKVSFKKDSSWVSQLVSLVCVSIAAKVEETHFPALMDLQVEEYLDQLFGAKTMQRMELMVLSKLEWRMHPVTPIKFVDFFVRRFKLICNVHSEFLKRCESTVLSIITDYRLVDYLPSVIAAATMLFVIREIKPCDAQEYQSQFMNLLKISKEDIDECHKLIIEATGDHYNKICHKRKFGTVPRSPSGVVDAYFSCDSSNDSCVGSSITSSVSSSPEQLFKRTKTQDPLMSMGVGLVGAVNRTR